MPLRKSNGLPQMPTQSLPDIEVPEKSLPPINDYNNNNFDNDFIHVDDTEEDFQDIQYESNEIELPEIPKQEEETVNHQLSDNPFDDVKQEEYIDYKKKKIKPLGGKKSKIKDKDLDDRKNKLNMISMLRLFIFICIIIAFALGIKNTWFPERVYTNRDIANIAVSAIGKTGFPLERGRAFSQEYLYHYLNNTEESRELLQKFGSDNRQIQNKSQQKPALIPILYSEQTDNYYSGIYKYSVYITDFNGKTYNEDEHKEVGHWLSFMVQVYYDNENDSLTAIDTPTLIPTYIIDNDNSKIPQAEKLGTGEVADKEVQEDADPTIKGFIKAFMDVDKNNYDEIVQYIPSDKPLALINGFGGTVKLADKSNINYKIYKTEKANSYIAEVDLQLQNAQTNPIGSGTIYNAKYVLRFEKTSDNKYLVTKFAPYLYSKDLSIQQK